MAKILIVDDEASIRMIVSRILTKDSHKVFTAENGVQALQVAVTERPEVVLLDYRLQGEDGMEILLQLKAQHPDCAVIMVTGYGRIETAVDLLKQGAFDFLPKPFDNDVLLQVVRRALAHGHETRVFGLPVSPKKRTGSGAAGWPHSPWSLRDARIEREDSNRKEPPEGLSPKTKRIPIKWVVGTVAVVGVLAGSLVWWREFRDRPPVQFGEWLVPGSHVAAMAWEGNRLWVSDWYLEKIYVMGPPSHLIVEDSLAMPHQHMTGLAVLADEIVYCDPQQRKIFLVNRRALKPRMAVESPGQYPAGLCVEGDVLWTLDRDTRRIYRHALDDQLTVTGSWPAPASSLVGIASFGGRLWLADAHREMLMEMDVRADGSLVVKRAYQLPARRGRLSAFTMRKNGVWLSYEGEALVLRRGVGSLKVIALEGLVP